MFFCGNTALGNKTFLLRLVVTKHQVMVEDSRAWLFSSRCAVFTSLIPLSPPKHLQLLKTEGGSVKDIVITVYKSNFSILNLETQLPPHPEVVLYIYAEDILIRHVFSWVSLRTAVMVSSQQTVISAPYIYLAIGIGLMFYLLDPVQPSACEGQK